MVAIYVVYWGFRPVVELAELADRPTGCGEVARGGCFICFEI